MIWAVLELGRYFKMFKVRHHLEVGPNVNIVYSYIDIVIDIVFTEPK